MTSFILGATGFVGREVVRQLCVRGEKTIAHIRPDSSSLETWRKTFGELGATVDVTSWDATKLAIAIATSDRLYILIGTTRGKAKTDHVEGNIYEQIDLGLTRIAVDAAKQSGKQIRLVYLSSVGADASARSAYLKARGQAEDVVKGANLPWVIARPSIITGDRDDSRIGESAGAVIGDGLLAVVGMFGGRKTRAKYKSTTPDVLASSLIRIGEAAEHGVIVDGADLR